MVVCQRFAKLWLCCAAPRSESCCHSNFQRSGIWWPFLSTNGSILLSHLELWREGRQPAVQRGRRHLCNLSRWFQRAHSPPLSGKNVLTNSKIIKRADEISSCNYREIREEKPCFTGLFGLKCGCMTCGTQRTKVPTAQYFYNLKPVL